MNTVKLIVNPLIILINITLFLSLISLLLKRFKASHDEEGKLKFSFSIWFSALFISSVLILTVTLSKTMEAADNLLRIQGQQIYLAIGKSIGLLTGLSLLWFLLWYFACKFLIRIIMKDTNDEAQMAADNYSYFLVKGILFSGILIAVSGVFEMILRSFMPSVELPIFH